MPEGPPSPAHALSQLIAALAALAAGPMDVSGGVLDVPLEAPKARAALEWGALLGFVELLEGHAALTEAGARFVADVPARPELYHAALRASAWFARGGADAALEAQLAAWSPRRRRSAEHVLTPALDPSAFDWATGEARLVASSVLPFELERPPFITALTGFLGDSRAGLEISFPAGLGKLLGEGGFDAMIEDDVAFANVSAGAGWGGLPLTPELIALGSAELGLYAVGACPYVLLATAILSAAQSRYGEGGVYIARDLWGVSLWQQGHPRGDLLVVVEDAARELGLRVARTQGPRGDASLLVELLRAAGVVAPRRTRYELRAGFLRRTERRSALDLLWGGTLAQRLAVIVAALAEWLLDAGVQP